MKLTDKLKLKGKQLKPVIKENFDYRNTTDYDFNNYASNEQSKKTPEFKTPVTTDGKEGENDNENNQIEEKRNSIPNAEKLSKCLLKLIACGNINIDSVNTSNIEQVTNLIEKLYNNSDK